MSAAQDAPGPPLARTSPVIRSLPGAVLDKGDILRLGRLTRGRSDPSSTPRATSSSAAADSPGISSSTRAGGGGGAADGDTPKSPSDFWDNSSSHDVHGNLGQGGANVEGSEIGNAEDAPAARSLRARLAKFAALLIRTNSNQSSETGRKISGQPTISTALSPTRALFVRFRAALKSAVESRPTEILIMSMIIGNIICLAAMDPLDPDSSTKRMQVLGAFNDAFTILFLIEMCCRMISEGIVGQRAYFSSSWNCFDCLITVLSLADLIAAGSSGSSGLGSVKSLRALRGLRALRLISSLKDLRFIVSLLVQCIPMLLNVIALLFFVFIIFGIVGVQLFQGVMRQYCVDKAGHIVNSLRHCNINDPDACAVNQTCVLTDSNPNHGAQSFDTVPAAVMTLFQILTLQDVGMVIERVQSGTSAYSVYFFLIYTLIGPVVVLNLFLAVIASSFEKSKNAFNMVSSAPTTVSTNTPGAVTQASTISSSADDGLKAANGDVAENQSDCTVSSASTTVLNAQVTPSPGKAASTAQSISASVKNVFAFISNKIHPGGGGGGNSSVDDAMSVVPGNAAGPKANQSHFCVRHLAMLRRGSLEIVESEKFGNFMTFIIFLTVITMAITKSDESDAYYMGLDVANVVYTFFFLVEMLMKHAAYGFKPYWFNALNAADGVIVILSCVDAISFLAQVDSVVGGGVSVLRAFRLFRIMRAVKLVRFFPSLVQQIKVLQASLAAISSLCLLISLWIVIFAILGMNIFGGKLVDEDTGVAPRLNFDTFYTALLTVFVVFTTEGFPTIFAYCAAGAGFGAAVPFFYILLFVGTFMLFNLFIAIIIEEFRSNKSDSVGTKKKSAPSKSNDGDPNSLGARVKKFFSFQERINLGRRESSLFYPNGVFCVLAQEQMQSVHDNDIAVAALQRMGYSLVGKSMMMFTPLHPVRFWCNTVILNPHFESVVTFFIMLSSVSLGLNGYELSDDFRRGLDIFDTVLLVVFAFELLLKVITHGLVIGPGAYLKSDWNKVDFVVVIAGVIDQIAGIFLSSDNPALNYIRIIRVLRAFRPLRLIARYEGLRIVFRTIAKSIEPVLSTVAIVFAAFSIYGILGVQLFMEKFRSCNDSSIVSKGNCVGNYVDSSGFRTPRQWISPPLNFDHLGNALLCLFILSTQDDWTNFMWQGIDAVSPEDAPVNDTNPAMALYFVSFMMIGNLLLLNVFVGVFADSYSAANINMLKDRAAQKKLEAPLLEASPLGLDEASDAGADEATPVLPQTRRLTNVARVDADHAALSRVHGQTASPGIARVSRDSSSRKLSLFDPGSPSASPVEVGSSAAALASYAANKWAQMSLNRSTKVNSPWATFLLHAKELDAKSAGFVQPIRNFILSTSLNAESLRVRLRWLVTHSFFDALISICIGLSIISMTFDSFQAEDWQNQLIEYASTLFTAVFGIEVILKVFVLYPDTYFSDGWNRFDYIVSMLALLAFPLEQFSSSFNPKVIRAVRLVRVIRSIRIFKFAQGMAQLIQSIVRSFPSVSNLFAIMFLGVFVYAVLGVELFGDMCSDSDDPLSIRCRAIDPSFFLSDRANFRNLGNACYVMYRLIISDNWSEILQTMIVVIPNCQSSGQYNTCGIPGFAPIYFISFVVVTALSLLNILVAIMIYFFDAPEDVNMHLTPHLTKDLFIAVVRRWKRNAMRIKAGITGAGLK